MAVMAILFSTAVIGGAFLFIKVFGYTSTEDAIGSSISVAFLVAIFSLFYSDVEAFLFGEDK
jgi:hypothetical protein